MKMIEYTRGDPAKRAKHAERLLKRLWRKARKLRKSMWGKSLNEKIAIQRRVVTLERHHPRIKALWVCYTWLAEDANA